jgi:hypothetical protein
VIASNCSVSFTVRASGQSALNEANYRTTIKQQTQKEPNLLDVIS